MIFLIFDKFCLGTLFWGEGAKKSRYCFRPVFLPFQAIWNSFDFLVSDKILLSSPLLLLLFLGGGGVLFFFRNCLFMLSLSCIPNFNLQVKLNNWITTLLVIIVSLNLRIYDLRITLFSKIRRLPTLPLLCLPNY